MPPTGSLVYPWIGIGVGYLLVLLANPIRVSLRDGFRCILRFKRIWLTFVLLGLAYAVFQIATFSPIQSASELDFQQMISLPGWHWPRLIDVWRDIPLPALEGVAGIFDNATTMYPISVIAAIMFVLNWRGLHGSLLRALFKRFRYASVPIYLVLLLATFATLVKPVVFWRLPSWGNETPISLLQVSALIDSIAFIFEYLFGIYIQVYLITVCLAWIKGLSFQEVALFRFAMRRFTYVLKWSGIVLVVGLLVVRLPLVLAYFMKLPGVLDYLPLERALMSGLIILFSTMQVSLVLHNESLRQAFRAHASFLRRNGVRFGWFLLICALHFFLLSAADAVMRGAIVDRVVALLLWRFIYIVAHGFLIGWLLASWVCLFRKCETSRVNQETWIAY